MQLLMLRLLSQLLKVYMEAVSLWARSPPGAPVGPLVADADGPQGLKKKDNPLGEGFRHLGKQDAKKDKTERSRSARGPRARATFNMPSAACRGWLHLISVFLLHFGVFNFYLHAKTEDFQPHWHQYHPGTSRAAARRPAAAITSGPGDPCNQRGCF